MNEMENIIQAAVDAYHGKTVKYSADETMDMLRNALVAANNGSTRLNYKNIRDGKCNGLFTIVEEILSRTIVDGLQNDDFFMSMVDFRNIALGDENKFLVEDEFYFEVAEIAEGTQGIRRQRLNGMSEVSLATSLRAVKIYEELNRVLSGQVDFNRFIALVGESFRRQMLNDIYSLWQNASGDEFGSVYFPAASATYDESALLRVIAHVEAAAGGKTATIIGTKPMLRNLAPSVQGLDSTSDLYNLGLEAA